MEEHKNKLNSYLKENWSKMEFTPSDDVWNQLSSSLKAEQLDQFMRSSFDKFEEAPSDAVLDKLLNDLSEQQTLRSGFDSWEESIAVPGFESLRQDLNNDLFDQSIKESYEEWSGGNSRDLWGKLDEELSRESVWLRLQQSLNSYRYEPSLWRGIVAVAAMLLLFFRIADEPTYVTTFNRDSTFVAETNTAVTGSVDSGTSSNVLPDAVPSPVVSSPANKNQVRQVAQYANANNQEDRENTLLSQENASDQADQKTDLNNDVIAETPNVESSSADVASLPCLGISPVNSTLAIRYPESNDRHFNHFSVEVGPQLAILTERSEPSLSTFTPGLGFGGNVNYRYTVGPIMVSHGIGYSSYNQQSGDYVNGRYRTGDQRLNAVQFNTVAGVHLKRVQLYGGFVLSRVLSGIERSGSTVTKVYHFDPIAPGLITGLNVNLFDFGKSSLGTGVQYSWVRGLNNKENSLSNVQGIRLNLVYSF